MTTNLFNRFDVYLSYWILAWAIISIFLDITFPIISLLIVFLAQYIYTKNNLCKITYHFNYVIHGNFTILFIKYLLLVYALIYKTTNYSIYNELVLLVCIYIIFNIYYKIVVGKVFIPKLLDSSNKTYEVDDGPFVTLFKNLYGKN